MAAVGIDIGTVSSTVAVCQGDQVDVIVNSFGSRKTPSCVVFGETERLVGSPAVHQRTKHVRSTVYEVKRLMGRRFADTKIQEYVHRWPFSVVDVNSKARVKLTYKESQLFLPPEQITAMVVKSLLESSERFLGVRAKDVVIAVPACFDNAQRQATLDAGKIAGVNDVRLINEPTAVALVHAHNTKPSSPRDILVYSLGAGSFDVSVVTIQAGPQVTVRATAGDPHLGGCDFDDLLVRHLADEFILSDNRDVLKHPKALLRLRLAVERLKQELTGLPESTIDIDNLVGEVDFVTVVSRNTFESLCSGLVSSTLLLVEKALAEAGVVKSEIEEVLLVGGSTRIPMVKAFVQDFLPGTLVRDTINSEDAVAQGAALFAARRGAVADVATHSVRVDRNVLVSQNTQIPVTVDSVLSYEDLIVPMSVKVIEGDKEKQPLASFTLDVTSALIKCDIDSNGVIGIAAFENDDRKNPIICWEEKGLTEVEMEAIRRTEGTFNEEDEQERMRCEARNQYEQYLYWMKSTVDSATEDQILTLRVYFNEALLWLENNQMASKEMFLNRLKSLQNAYTSVMRVPESNARPDRVSSYGSTEMREPSESGTAQTFEWSKKLILMLFCIAFFIFLCTMIIVGVVTM